MTGSQNGQARGLTPSEVERSRQKNGVNVLHSAKRKGFWRIFFKNLGDPVIKVLLIALGLHLLLLFHDRDWVETVGIGVSVLLATMISSASEYGGESAFRRLQESCGTQRCRVRRDGTVLELDVAELVVGDVVLLGAGERIPADGWLISGKMTVDQSPLTGESAEVQKQVKRGKEALSPVAEAALLCGCTIRSGEGEMRVAAVGDRTLLGGISGELQEDTRESPLQLRLAKLARQISVLGYIAAAICAFSFLFYRLVVEADFSSAEMLTRVQSFPFMAETLLHALTLALTVVVVAVPEGLPMMIAVVLSANVRRMVKDQVLVRKPAGLEAAGSMNLLFTDKTGTLTAGRLTTAAVLTAWGEYQSPRSLRCAAPLLYEQLSLCAHYNSGAVRGLRNGTDEALGGNATDRALLSAFLEDAAPPATVSERLPFDSERKYAAVRLADGRVLVTGAPERLAPYLREAIAENGDRVPFAAAPFLTRVRAHTLGGERAVLLCAADRMPTALSDLHLCLLAAVTFTDPLRPEAAGAVRKLQGAGVQVVMITGDSRETAAHVAGACGILRRGGVVLEGSELSALSDEEVTALLPRLAVLARALPGDKSRLVRLSEAAGLVVGMTGDGINDAPALKMADVGFAMGSGTQVAKEAADVLLLDDNLTSVCKAVLYGRTVFKSIRKFITLQLVMNFCAVGISVIGPFIGFDAPVTVVQMLWINLIMDTLGGLAFAGEAPMPHYMREAPKSREEPILSRAIARRIAALTLFVVAMSVMFLTLPRIGAFYRTGEGELRLLTAFFAFFIFAGVFNCFNARTDRVRMLAGIGKNPAFLLIMSLVCAVQIFFVYAGGAVLRTLPLAAGELLLALGLAATVLPFGFLQLVATRLWGGGDLY